MDTNDTAIGGVPAPVGQVLDQQRECMKLVEALEDCLDRKPEPADENEILVAAVFEDTGAGG